MKAKNDQVEELIEQARWEDARRLIQKELKSDPDDHWLLTRLATTLYEQGDYENALHWVEKAKRIAPNCPLVLWDYAGTLDMLGREREAIDVYHSLLQRGVEAIAEDECGEGVSWAESLLTDCVYRAGQCYEDIQDHARAASLYRLYLSLLDMGVASIYPREPRQTREEFIHSLRGKYPKLSSKHYMEEKQKDMVLED